MGRHKFRSSASCTTDLVKSSGDEKKDDMNLTLEDILRFHEFDVLQSEMLENIEEKLHVCHKKNLPGQRRLTV